MAFVRVRRRKDGSNYFSVYFTLDDGTQTSESYDDRGQAEATCALFNSVGTHRAMELLGIERETREQKASTLLYRGMTVEQYLNQYIDLLTGIDKGTRTKYRAYVRNDIAHMLGDIPLTELNEIHCARWVQWLEEHGSMDRKGNRRPAKPKTIANKHGFLSGALEDAVRRKLIESNPAAGRRLKKDDARDAEDEMVFLSREEFGRLLEHIPDHYKVLVEFLVASGCRWGEASALKPEDVNLAEGTVRIRRAWTYSPGGYRMVKTKGNSRRTINVARSVLEKLDLSGEWVFVNYHGGPIRIHGFHNRVWRKAVRAAGLNPRPRVHDLRHTCASWMVAKNVPPKVIQEHLGHEHIETTMKIYSHLDRATAALAAEAIEDVLAG